MVFYVKKLKGVFHGKQWGPFIFILKKYKDDIGLLKHEKVHTKQWWTRGLFIQSLRYKFSEDYRYQCELEAYREQLKYSDHPIYFANFITLRYNLNITYEQALNDLLE